MLENESKFKVTQCYMSMWRHATYVDNIQSGLECIVRPHAVHGNVDVQGNMATMITEYLALSTAIRETDALHMYVTIMALPDDCI